MHGTDIFDILLNMVQLLDFFFLIQDLKCPAEDVYRNENDTAQKK